MKLLKSISAKVGTATLAAGAWVGVAFAQFSTDQVEVIAPPADVSIRDTISFIVNIILAIVGILAVIYLIYGGILYITAGGDAEKAGKGRTAITNAIIGIVIILASLIIYNGVVKSFNNQSLQ